MILDRFKLTDQVAVVTGGGTGIGGAIARGFAEAGARVAVAGRRAEPLEEVCREIASKGGEAIAVPADVTDCGSLEALVKAVTGRWGKIDILVNSAGILVKAPAEDMTDTEWRRVIDANLTGTFLACRAVAPGMIERRGGRMINVASVTSFDALPNVPAYVASKGGVLQLTKALARDWARYGIRVNGIAPGFFITDLNRDVIDDERQRRIMEKTPLGRLGELSDLVGAAVYLASRASDFVTGTTIVVDGGFLAAGF